MTGRDWGMIRSASSDHYLNIGSIKFVLRPIVMDEQGDSQPTHDLDRQAADVRSWNLLPDDLVTDAEVAGSDVSTVSGQTPSRSPADGSGQPGAGQVRPEPDAGIAPAPFGDDSDDIV